MRDIKPGDKIIDSRDVIKRHRELEDELTALYDEATAESEDAPELEDWLDEMTGKDDWDYKDEAQAFIDLKTLIEEAEGYAPDWLHGATLIHSEHFTDYCEELVKDIGDLPRDLPGYLVIDWEATAENLKEDYTEVSYGDETYFIR